MAWSRRGSLTRGVRLQQPFVAGTLRSPLIPDFTRTDRMTTRPAQRVAKIALICVAVAMAVWLVLRSLIVADDFPAARRGADRALGGFGTGGWLTIQISHLRPNARWNCRTDRHQVVSRRAFVSVCHPGSRREGAPQLKLRR